MIQTKLLPNFKNKKMCDITPRDITQWQNVMIEGRTKCGNEYAATYLKTLQAQLSCIFNHVVRFYELHSNPVVKADALGVLDAEEMQFWIKEEYLQFIPTLADKTYSYLAFELLYWCGMRMGELRALTAGDFDFTKNTVSITKSYQRIKGRDVITVTKTKKSIRTVVMPRQVAIEMKDFIDSIYVLESTDLMFTFSKFYLYHEMDRGSKASGVKRIRVHDLRHSNGSLLINMGFTALAIGNRVGHESKKITYCYAHLFPFVQDDKAIALDAEWKEGFDVTED